MSTHSRSTTPDAPCDTRTTDVAWCDLATGAGPARAVEPSIHVPAAVSLPRMAARSSVTVEPEVRPPNITSTGDRPVPHPAPLSSPVSVFTVYGTRLGAASTLSGMHTRVRDV